MKLFTSFDNPETHKTHWFQGKHQFYLAGTWRGKMYILTDQAGYLRRLGNVFVAKCVAQDGSWVHFDSDGNMLDGPYSKEGRRL